MTVHLDQAFMWFSFGGITLSHDSLVMLEPVHFWTSFSNFSNVVLKVKTEANVVANLPLCTEIQKICLIRIYNFDSSDLKVNNL